MDASLQTERTTVRRLPKRGTYDRERIYSILDDGFLCHLGFVDNGQPYVIPTGYARSGDTLYMHGSAASRMLRTASSGVAACVTVTLVDAFVLARSVFHHSMNYRSVVVLGTARLVTEPDEKLSALECFTNRIVPDRWNEARRPTEQELKATTVIAVAIGEASAKIRTGPAVDDEEDYALPIWAGIVPMQVTFGTPVRDARLSPEIPDLDRRRLDRDSRNQ